MDLSKIGLAALLVIFAGRAITFLRRLLLLATIAGSATALSSMVRRVKMIVCVTGATQRA